MVAAVCSMGRPIGNLALEIADAAREVRRSIDGNVRNWLTDIDRCHDAYRPMH